MMVEGAKFPPIIAWKVSNTMGSFSFSRSNLSLVCFGLLTLFRRRWNAASTSRDRFQCLLLENFVFWQCSLLIGSAFSLEYNQSGCGVVIWAMPGPSSGCFVMTKSVCQHKIVKGGNSRSLSPLSFVSSLLTGPQMPCQFPQVSLPTFAF